MASGFVFVLNVVAAAAAAGNAYQMRTKVCYAKMPTMRRRQTSTSFSN